MAQTQSIEFVDDFENFPINQLGAANPPPFVIGNSTSLIRSVVIDEEAYGGRGKSLKLEFNVRDSLGACGQVIPLLNSDLSAYNYLSFKVKSPNPNLFFQIELQRANDSTSSKIAIGNYLQGGPTSNWQKVVIPLQAFWNFNDLTDISALVFVFENVGSNLNNSPFEGEILLDDMLFGSYFPGYVKLDHFDDLYGSNATGANWGTLSSSGNPNKYTAAIDCSTFHEEECGLEIQYDNDLGTFGGLFFILGGGETGWIQMPQDLSAFESLHIALKGNDPNNNPGNLKLELKTQGGGFPAPNYRVFNIPDTGFMEFDIPFSSFSPPLNSSIINELTIIFEDGWQNQSEGIVHVDEIEFRAQGYSGPDLEFPSTPSGLMVNGHNPEKLISLPSQQSVNLRIAQPSIGPKLENIRLEYKTTCEPDWKILDVKYIPFVDSVFFTISGSDFISGELISLRVCAENYNGLRSCSEEFDLIIEPSNYSVDSLFRDAYEVMRILRSETGVYRDSWILDGAPYHPASVATTGMGIISLCIADSMGWISNAEGQVLHTLKAMNGLNKGFLPDRNQRGLFRHFIDLNSGARAWDSEYSSIDSGILTAGALFAKKYFPNNDSISLLADWLYLSTDWASNISNPNIGAIFRIQNKNGMGTGITLPFNEYMIVAWLASKDLRYTPNGEVLWSNYYQNPSQLPQSSFCNFNVLTDNSGSFLSNFIPQFCYFLCAPFSQDQDYMSFFDQSRKKDSCWWRTNSSEPCFVWGFGAGASPDSVGGYHADNCTEHPGDIVSPHIIAGFIPVNQNLIGDLMRLYAEGKGRFRLNSTSTTEFLWRFSTLDSNWIPRDLQGIDFSSMLFGLASHQRFLGPNFFPFFNDFDFPDPNSMNKAPYIKLNQDTLCIKNGRKDTINLVDRFGDFDDPNIHLKWRFEHGNGVVTSFDSSTYRLLIESSSTSDSIETIFVHLEDRNGNTTVDSLVINTISCFNTNINDLGDDIHDFNIFPNPNSGELTLRLVLRYNTYSKINIHSIDGKQIYETLQRFNQGENYWKWNSTADSKIQLIKGIYILSIETKSSRIMRKLVIQ
ncbi:MAG: T9SS type A sorting domain-containing protein [Bacteroidia bacterium]|nr:T9SS type A sorting domain-containing protein [Bacteroidia bacterium]